MGRGTGRRGSFCDPFAAEAVKASRRPNRRLIQGGEGWLRGRSALWRNRQYNACCQKPLSRDFENHRPESKGAWLLDWPLRLMPPSDPKKPASPRAMCGRQTALVFAHACGSLWGPWAQGILWTHALLRLPWHGWGNEQEPLLRKDSTRIPLNSDFPRRTAMLRVFLKFFICQKLAEVRLFCAY